MFIPNLPAAATGYVEAGRWIETQRTDPDAVVYLPEERQPEDGGWLELAAKSLEEITAYAETKTILLTPAPAERAAKVSAAVSWLQYTNSADQPGGKFWCKLADYDIELRITTEARPRNSAAEPLTWRFSKLTRVEMAYDGDRFRTVMESPYVTGGATGLAAVQLQQELERRAQLNLRKLAAGANGEDA